MLANCEKHHKWWFFTTILSLITQIRTGSTTVNYTEDSGQFSVQFQVHWTTYANLSQHPLLSCSVHGVNNVKEYKFLPSAKVNSPVVQFIPVFNVCFIVFKIEDSPVVLGWMGAALPSGILALSPSFFYLIKFWENIEVVIKVTVLKQKVNSVIKWFLVRQDIVFYRYSKGLVV